MSSSEASRFFFVSWGAFSPCTDTSLNYEYCGPLTTSLSSNLITWSPIDRESIPFTLSFMSSSSTSIIASLFMQLGLQPFIIASFLCNLVCSHSHHFSNNWNLASLSFSNSSNCLLDISIISKTAFDKLSIDWCQRSWLFSSDFYVEVSKSFLFRLIFLVHKNSFNANGYGRTFS